MAAIGEIGNHAHNWLSWCSSSYISGLGLASKLELNENKFNLYLKTKKLQENELEIPIFIFNTTTISEPIPLHIHRSNFICNRRSADVLFNDGRVENIVQAKLKDKLYYRGRGLLLNASLEPIMLITGTSLLPTDGSLRLRQMKFYCNPIVFEDTQNALNKYIITHIMPGLLKEDFTYYYGYHPDYASHKYEICVSNEIFDFFERPIVNTLEDMDNKCNEILRANLDKIKIAYDEI